MRAKIDAELAAVAEEVESGGLTWCRADVQRLISPYPKHATVDNILDRLGDTAGTDAVHDCFQNGEDVNDDPAVADAASSDSADEGNADADAVEENAIVSTAAAIAERLTEDCDKKNVVAVAERHVLGPEHAAAVDLHEQKMRV